jgi:hypothetical protein
MDALIGRAPVEPEDKAKTVPTCANYKWIVENFAECPAGANEDTVKVYTKVYVSYIISRSLFDDNVGKWAQWCWLKALTILYHKWSWGTATLSYLYRHVMICYIYSSCSLVL